MAPTQLNTRTCKVHIPHDAEAYKIRSRIEKFFSKLKHCRQVATLNRLHTQYLVFLHLASAMLSLRWMLIQPRLALHREAGTPAQDPGKPGDSLVWKASSASQRIRNLSAPDPEPSVNWLGVGGTPESFIRVGLLDLPLMVAIIGGTPERFRPLVDLYRQAGAQARHSPERLIVGFHAIGDVAESNVQAAEDFSPGHLCSFNEIGKERG